MNKEVLRIPDERWGHVNSYHQSVLEQIFKKELSEKKEQKPKP
ncbi:MAG: hypothetical protein NTX45_23895 [Proteobacteria bacterium]|nr:hypothetical protein [Pseudomonadota bacterium]